MPSNPIAAVMIHVPDPQAGLAWYQRAFPLARREVVEENNFEFLRLGAIEIEIVPADKLVSAGPCGSVVYWQVADLTDALTHLQALGAKLYRGPLRIEDGLSICQVQDPWGNCIGLRGPQPAPVIKPSPDGGPHGLD